MSWLDGVIIVLAVLCGIAGWRAGLVRSVLLVAGLYVAALLGAQISDPLARALTDAVDSAALASVIAYGIILFAVFVTAQVMGGILTGMLKKVSLGWTDDLGGAALGLLAGWVLGGILVAGMARFAFQVPEGRVETAGSLLTEVNVRQSLKDALVDSALVPSYLETTDKLPGRGLGLAPGGFWDALDALRAYRHVEG